MGWNSLASQTLLTFAGLGLMSALLISLAAIDRGVAPDLRPL
ncbi:protein of unknown function [Bradyrhizobium vignae]|uniref:Uncharacterized protein n=1 Tax=Bradyrhizobium vignae TaxID=1549949 RepID=A0A2U3PRY9_9BRAD|nr:protein of unknown function [Bradyrhizobium vignae]